MHHLWIKTACLTATLALTVSFGFAAEPVLPAAKDAAKAKAAETKAAAKTEATKTADTKAAATKAVAAKVAETKDAAKTKAAATKAAAKAKLEPVDINTATEAELKAIPGVGDAYAARIIAGRPYAKKDQLKSRNILPGPVYDQVKDNIVAKQPAKTAPKKK